MKSILVIEDNKTLALNLATMLRDKRYAVKSVFTFNRALEVLEKQQFDLIILDRQLPDGNGLDLLPIPKDRYFSTRVLVLSHKSKVSERVLGFSPLNKSGLKKLKQNLLIIFCCIHRKNTLGFFY